VTPDDALRRLVDGNRRFAEGQALGEGRDARRRADTADGQWPFAVILGCADSRVPPEILFDQGIGDLFVVRVAGNTATAAVVAQSVEFGVLDLRARLVVVLGHEGCGAVQAALDHDASGAPARRRLASLIEPISEATNAVAAAALGARLEAAVRANAVQQVRRLAARPNLTALVEAGELRIVAAAYDLGGHVQLLDPADR
jgi:carbonic anhydrase